MLPLPRSARQSGVAPPRQSAVLLTLFLREKELLLLLTRRTERTRHHKGQIALPGGARDPEDGSLWGTALREAEEEVGLHPADVELLGALSPLYVSASNFFVHPFVGWVQAPPTAWIAAPDEVAEVIELPLRALTDPAVRAEATWPLADRVARVPHYVYGEQRVWGATAMILSELEVLLAALAPPKQGDT
jgi:8-oxo-dGTP pyrophosphatase MutT (NUDIX family)